MDRALNGANRRVRHVEETNRSGWLAEAVRGAQRACRSFATALERKRAASGSPSMSGK